MASPDWPPHAYVPGLTARHPEDFFDQIKASVNADVPLSQVHQTEAFQIGLQYLHAGFYWECHELLEAVWMHTPLKSVEREMTQGIIQLANAALKQRMAKPRAVARLVARVNAHLAQCPADQQVLGLSVAEVEGWLCNYIVEI